MRSRCRYRHSWLKSHPQGNHHISRCGRRTRRCEETPPFFRRPWRLYVRLSIDVRRRRTGRRSFNSSKYNLS
jgi:hypothetical protein